MKQRFITAVILAAAASALLAVGGVVLAAALVAIICFAVYEEYSALTKAGHHPLSWPTWVGLALSVPLMAIGGARLLIPVAIGVALVTVGTIIFRREPKLEDILYSLIPFVFIVLPGMAMLALVNITPKSVQLTYFLLMIAVPCVGDIFALYVGSTLKGPKLCPPVSPNKTISGAVGGLIGSLLAALLVGAVAYALAVQSRAALPDWWHYVLLGLIGGAAGQLGDLFASLIKRHCGLKDFSNLFPGHGGMLDRLDSVIFMAIIIFCYRMLVL
nr:phosphatidate cytidylyltransferase [Clostridia bacterium]